MNPGVYTYSVDTSGCVSTAEVVVTEIVTTVTVNPTNINCFGFSNGSAQITVTNGNVYSLDGGTPTPITSSPFTISNLAVGPHVIVVAGLNGCGAFANFQINQPQPLQITTITPNLTACPEANTQLSAAATGGSSPYVFTWVANNAIVGSGANINVSPDVTTTYCVVLSEACGSLPDTACMTITVPAPINISIVPDDSEGCFPVPVTFTNNSTGSTIVTSQINFGDGNTTVSPGTNSFFNEYQTPGVYNVTITSTSNLGCVYDTTYTAMIEVFDNPEADFNINPNPVGMFDARVHLYNASSNDVVAFNWMINGGDPAQSANEDLSVQFEQGEAGNYNVTLYVTNNDGCVDSITKIAQVVSEVIVFAPNTFTPDDDERNPQWLLYIQGADVMQFNLKIYNRWGEIIWENNDPSIPWDGSYKGEICPQGVYSWTLETKDITTDKRYRFDGSINLLR
jgi:gliding motility-associated-like protein